jgi:predicted transcriptional regulator
MSSIELSPSQRQILSALVNLHGEHEQAVKGEQIAEEVDRNPGTIRNQMQSLKALQLVEGVPGPKGGYKPTAS